MKTNSTFLKYITAIFFTAAVVMEANAQSGSSGTPTLSFTSTPTLVPNTGTGYQVGTVYKFDNVAAGTNALVTILSATGGATVAMLDDNALTKPEAFSPRITVPANSTGMVKFKIDLVTSSGLPKIMTQFSATAMDIDGSSNLKERDAIDMGVGSVVSYLAALLEINVQLAGTEFLGVNTAGIEYDGVDTTAKQVMFTVTSPAVISSFTYSAGAANQTGGSVTRQKGIYFKGFDYITFLPVKYSAFDAQASGNAVNLKWVTESEINNSHFEVERSADGVNFKQIGTVAAGAATGNNSKSYTYIDNSIKTDVVLYYRLKQVDLDGRYNYSNTLAVRLESLTNIQMQVMPNPFAESLTVRFEAAEKATAQLQIFNSQGQLVALQNNNIAKGNNSIQVLGLAKLAPGTYIARLYANGTVAATQKIIKN